MTNESVDQDSNAGEEQDAAQYEYWNQLANQLFRFHELHVSQKLLTLSQKYYISDENNNPLFFVVRPPKLKINIALGFLYLIFRLVILYITFTLVVYQSQFVLGIFIFVVSNFVLSIAFSLASPYRHIEVYRDDTMQWRLLTITQDNKIGLYRQYTLYDMYGKEIALMQRNVFASIFRRDWWVTDLQGEFITRIREDSLIKSLLRRYLGPMYGLLRTNFNFEDDQSKPIGIYDRKLTITDQYRLMMDDDHYPIDRRICLAMAILLDTGESR